MMMYQAQRTWRLIVPFTFSIVTIILFYLYFFQLRSFYSGSETSEISALTSQPWRLTTSLSDDCTITSNVAAIIDTRPLDRLMPLLLHFSSVLGPEWPIFFFTSPRNDIPLSAPFERLIDECRIAVRFLPLNVDFNNRLDVSRFITEPWMWEQLSPAGHVIMFQSDSILCSGSTLKVDDFLEYDFVGAPIDPAYGEGYNGGLSLRNRSMVLDIISESNWSKEFDLADDKQQPSVEFEDQWFYKKMKELPNRGKSAARLPSLEVAKTFSVESIWYGKPLGYHQVQRWQWGRMDEVERWCPEYKIATSEVIG
ncbi:uncharacterized protein PAC_14798 [Phialocephala subalpina]|uniref:DUF5672 domain-containing protein n=1 Tax=Phialocephala subalpina TaxID=576137 RepID=A0A1L7XIQ4_9HELO|nr:uncharacterized protein PAC_14798 [Phialocephala subalpina]